MATRTESERIRGTSAPTRTRGIDETKWAVKTTEIVAYIVTVIAVLIAAAVDDSLDGRGA
jgi:hypothetical protein